MNELKNIRSQLTDDKRPHESVQQSTEELMEIGIEGLEEVVGGGGDGTAVGVGHN
jgi:hypothetical protein